MTLLAICCFSLFIPPIRAKFNIAHKALAESTDGKQSKSPAGQKEAYRLGVLLPLFFEKDRKCGKTLISAPGKIRKPSMRLRLRALLRV